MMLWTFLYSLLYPFLRLLLVALSFGHKKIRQGLSLRKKQQGIHPWLLPPAESKPIWFHCASGEFEYAKPVIREIKKQAPQTKILVTYFSPSVLPSIQACPDVDFHCPTPWDTASHWNAFIEHHQPKALLIARTDLWPMMIRTVKKHKVPSLLFSKTVNQSKKAWQNIFSHSLMKQLDDIFCVSEDDRQRLLKALAPFTAVHAAGDTRYDQCFYRLAHGKTLKPLNNFSKPLFIVGSSWPADEEVLIELMAHHCKDVSFVVAPHEPSTPHLQSLQKKIANKGLASQMYSQTQSWNPDHVLIIDQVGILADLYKWGSFAYIGGSMDRSVHSVMEPLTQGLLCFVGPKHLNNREAIEFEKQSIKGIAPIQVVHSSAELITKFDSLYTKWSRNHQLDLQLSVKQKMGASSIVLQWLNNQQTL